jgi:hypothetical protein
MAGVSFPVTRPIGRALVVGTASTRAQPLAQMQALGYTCAEIDDPYAAAAEVFRRPLVYRAVILSLTSMYREELALIASLKRRLPHVDIWLTHTEGRHAAMAEAIRIGADGLLAEDGALHRLGMPHPQQPTGQPLTDDVRSGEFEPVAQQHVVNPVESEIPNGEPVLSADELRALLQEDETPMPPAEGQ